MERKLLELENVELKFVEGRTATTFAGYGAIFGNVDKGGDIILPGAFTETLKNRQRAVKMYFNHDRRMPIGKYSVVSEDAKGLYLEGELTPRHTLAQDVEAGMRHGTIDGLSIGYRIPAGGAQKDGRVRRLTKLDLGEVSVVSEPMNELARVMLDSVKSDLDSLATITDLENFLRDAGGFSKSAAMALLSRAKSILREADDEERKRSTEQQGPTTKDLLALIQSFRY